MPHDKNGNQLEAGDRVTITCVVKEVHAGENECNVTLETEESGRGTYKPTIVTNSAAVELIEEEEGETIKEVVADLIANGITAKESEDGESVIIGADKNNVAAAELHLDIDLSGGIGIYGESDDTEGAKVMVEGHKLPENPDGEAAQLTGVSDAKAEADEADAKSVDGVNGGEKGQPE